MQKHSFIIQGTQLSCSLHNQQLAKPLPLPQNSHQKFIHHSYLHHQAGPGINVYELPCCCFLWHFKSGGRFITKLPQWPLPK